MNYYYNPFFNRSEWELPKDASLTPFQQNKLVLEELPNQQEEENIIEYKTTQIEGNYYDEEAWDENELTEKLIWDKMKEQQLKEYMKRPARQQVTDSQKETAYMEGNYDYNIWYDKFLTDRKQEKEKIPALHRCNPALDTGYTKADLQEKDGGAFFCLYFAKGCCSEGVNCRYYHRVPTKCDAEKIENLRDVFGRSRFANHRTDMGGVGSFTKECRSLCITDLKVVDTANPTKEMVRIIYEHFSPWGEIEDVNFIQAKATCFIRYAHRSFAEFAKEAMIGQSLVGEEVLTVKWAYDDPNPINKKRSDRENENRFLLAARNRNENISKKKSQIDSNYHRTKSQYSSGYGVEEAIRPVDEAVSNFEKLSKTLKMIDDFNNQENI
jgi:hypothetical protein